MGSNHMRLAAVKVHPIMSWDDRPHTPRSCNCASCHCSSLLCDENHAISLDNADSLYILSSSLFTSVKSISEIQETYIFAVLSLRPAATIARKLASSDFARTRSALKGNQKADFTSDLQHQYTRPRRHVRFRHHRLPMAWQPLGQQGDILPITPRHTILGMPPASDNATP